jgi:hypothetical protein
LSQVVNYYRIPGFHIPFTGHGGGYGAASPGTTTQETDAITLTALMNGKWTAIARTPWSGIEIGYGPYPYYTCASSGLRASHVDMTQVNGLWYLKELAPQGKWPK